MSTSDLSHVVSLSFKAHELRKKGHYARAVEKFTAALAAAQALSQQQDCLMVARLQLDLTTALGAYTTMPGVAAAAKSAALQQSAQMLVAAVATLNRRKAAGTLLPGACRSWPEQAWCAQLSQLQTRFTADECAKIARCMGYEIYLTAGSYAAGAHIVVGRDMLSASMTHALQQCAVQAIDLLEQSHPEVLALPVSIAAEENLSISMHTVVGDISSLPEAERATFAPLLVRWQRFERSGALQQRNLLQHVSRFEAEALETVAAMQAGPAPDTLRRCALGSCDARELHPAHFKKCAACQTVVYCCKAHQETDWPAHKAACKAARKAAAEGGASGA
jgi:hypothetical protein